jgi:outer membrane protein OmpA-like peptidoglycan-associated protein
MKKLSLKYGMKLILLIILSTGSLFSKASTYSIMDPNQFPPGSEEGIYILRYAGIVKAGMSVVVYNDSVYIPVSTFFNHLGIDNRFENHNKTITGFFVSTDSTYRMNFKDGIAVYNGRKYEIPQNQFILSDLEIYATPNLLSNIFDLQIRLVSSELELLLSSKVDLPVLADFKRRKGYTYQKGDFYQLNRFGPLLFDRNRSFLNGGFLTYNLTGVQTFEPRNRTYRYIFGLGMEVLGGDLQGNVAGFYNEATKTQNFNNAFRWGYFISDNPYLSQFSAGRLTTGGIYNTRGTAVQYNGVQISNDPSLKQEYFDNIIIEDRIDPEWQVELWVNNQLYANKQADLFGNFRFELPLRFGYTDVELKYYGPKGELITEKKVLNVPHEFLKPGEIRYSLGGGQRILDYEMMGAGRFALGITDFITNSSSVERTFSNDSISFFNHTGLRLFNNVITSFDILTNQWYKTEVYYNSKDYGSYRFDFTKYVENKSSFASRQNSISLDYNLPRFNSLPFTFMISANRNQFATQNVYQFIYRLQSYFSGFYINGTYSAGMIERPSEPLALNHFFSYSVNYTFYSSKSIILPFIFKNSRIGFSGSYDITKGKAQTSELSYQKLVGNLFELRLAGKYNFQTKVSGIYANLVFNLPAFRSTTNSNITKDNKYVLETIEGVVGYDSHNSDLFLRNTKLFGSMGYGAASLRFFLDDNTNGSFDEGEMEIPGVRSIMSHGIPDQFSDPTLKRVYSLNSYAKFNVIVDKESFKNPLWTPLADEFSFIADPNSFKPLDIPCYAAGVIEGSAYLNDGRTKKPKGGVKVHLVRSADSSWKEEVPVFTDGNFYFMGIPPGDYIAYIDSAQMDYLNVASVPPVINFTIKKTTTGDFVSNLNFELAPKGNQVVASIDNSKPENASKSIIPETSKTEKIVPKVLEEIKKETKPEKENAKPEEVKTKAKEEKETKPEDKKETKPEVVPVTKPAVVPQPKLADTIMFNPSEPKNLFFSGAKDTKLSPKVQQELDAIVKYLQGNASAKLAIIGHSDNFGSLDETQKLSEQRAQVIVSYMMKLGIPKDRLYPQGLGARSPLASNTTPQGRQKNRRVEIRVISK